MTTKALFSKIISAAKGKYVEALYEIWRRALLKAGAEQGLLELAGKLAEIVPDLSHIRTNYRVDTPFLITSYRLLDAFQVSLVQELLGEFEGPTIVDIGDSCGRHLEYLIGLHKDKQIQTMSVNLDPVAVEKIRARGLPAICDRAENLACHNLSADIFLCFEVLEHLIDPCNFLHSLSYSTEATYLIMTVPYVRQSRVALQYIRGKWGDRVVNGENTHIFELNPEDWSLLARFAGWQVVRQRLYRQYPLRDPFFFTKALWLRHDVTGFLGLILTRDHSYSDRYPDWGTELDRRDAETGPPTYKRQPGRHAPG